MHPIIPLSLRKLKKPPPVLNVGHDPVQRPGDLNQITEIAPADGIVIGGSRCRCTHLPRQVSRVNLFLELPLTQPPSPSIPGTSLRGVVDLLNEPLLA